MATDNPSRWTRERKAYLAIGVAICLGGLLMILFTR
jgi:hypothetical protein